MSAFQLENLTALQRFQFDRILNEDPITHTLTLLGTLPTNGDPDSEDRSPAIVRIEKTALSAGITDGLFSKFLQDIKIIENNDIYTWLFGWLTTSPERPDVKINVVYPATEVHIRKYSAQKIFMVHETPALYERIVKPYIAGFPSSRTQWVVDILEGRSEADKVLHRDTSEDYGYVLLPDMKWDLTTVSSLYLVAIASSPTIRSLRDLHKRHLSMLRSIRREAAHIAQERWGLSAARCAYHFHVHVVNVEYQGLLGMAVGQAHLLDDIISTLELDADYGSSTFERMTLTYGLGEQHGLFAQTRAAQGDIEY